MLGSILVMRVIVSAPATNGDTKIGVAVQLIEVTYGDPPELSIRLICM